MPPAVNLLPVLTECPKSMEVGPCGGVFGNGGCEVRPESRCVFLDSAREAPFATAERALLDERPSPANMADTSRGTTFDEALSSGRFAVVAEVNCADSADAADFVDASRTIAGVADVISITDHSGANVHMSNVAATAHLLAAGVQAMPTFACRDRNRIALQGDLLGVSSLGARNVLIVTGNHPEVGDSPDATPVFDLDSPRLVSVADRLRRQGRFDNGRPVDPAPQFQIGATGHPFAPPVEDRPRQALRKVAAGADFLITQHIFDLPVWRSFVDGVNAGRDTVGTFHLLGAVAVLPSEPIARAVNAGLRGFTIPEDTLARLKQAKDPQHEGVLIAAEIVHELHAQTGVDGVLIAPVTGRQNALIAHVEQRDLIVAVREAAGIPVGQHNALVTTP